MFFKKTPKRGIIVLNLVALIDICAMIIIFLVMGAIFGEASIDVPAEMIVPHSFNKESVENAPQIVILPQAVTASFVGQNIPLSAFQTETVPPSHLEQVKAYLASVPPEVKKSGLLLNVVADQNTPYRNIFDVVKFYREAGFHSVLFIARGK